MRFIVQNRDFLGNRVKTGSLFRVRIFLGIDSVPDLIGDNRNLKPLFIVRPAFKMIDFF